MELTEKMVEQGHYLGPSALFADEDFRYSHTFGRLTQKLANGDGDVNDEEQKEEE